MARYTRVYTNPRGTWITAFAPILDPGGRVAAVVSVDYPVEIYLDRLHELRTHDRLRLGDRGASAR